MSIKPFRESLLVLAVFMALAASFSTSTASATTLLFDFGSNDFRSANNYNNITDFPSSRQSIADAIDSTGANTGIALAVSGFFPRANVAGTTQPIGEAAAIFGPQATGDNVFTHVGPLLGEATNPRGVLAFSGLNPGRAYDFSFFASRVDVPDIREAQYTASGDSTGSVLLNASDNIDSVVHIPGIFPTASGEITVFSEAGPNNNGELMVAYLGAVRVVYVVPEPTSMALLALCFAGVAAQRRVVGRRT